MKPSKLYEALHTLIGERVPLRIWARAALGSHRSSPRSPTISTRLSQMCGPCNSIRSTCAAASNFGRPDRMGAFEISPDMGKGILFLDELTSAPQMTQAACDQLLRYS